MKKIINILLVISLVAITVTPLSASEFNESNQDYYFNLCSQTELTPSEEAKCDAFFDWLSEESDKIQGELDDLNDQMNDLKKDINKVMKMINDLDKSIKLKQNEITTTQSNINRLEIQIDKKKKEIEQREGNIETLDGKIKERMVLLQSVISTNGFIDFIFGAKDLVDLIRRIEGISDITSYDKENIAFLQSEIEKLEVDKEKLEKNNQDLKNRKSALEKTKVQLAEMKAKNQELLAVYRSKEAELEAAQQKAAQNLKEIQAALADLSSIGKVKWSKNVIKPVASGASVSAGTWYYPKSFCKGSGCEHLGIDIAAPVGTNVIAPATSVVMFMADKCPTYGYLGNWCGAPGSAGAGNQLMLLTVVKGITYVIRIGHLQSGVSKIIEWPRKDGKITVVTQGQVIGKIGSSGNSSGPHTHIEVLNFGKQSPASVAAKFAKEGLFDLGLGWGAKGVNNRCEVKSAPCRLKPESFFNVKVNQRW